MAWREDAGFGMLRFNKAKIAGKTQDSTQLAKMIASLGPDFTFECFRDKPVPCAKGGGAATGATGDENLIKIGANTFEQHILGAGQTTIVPVTAATGLNISLDQTENEGMELSQGIASGEKHAYVVGTDPAFYARCKFSIANVSGTDDCAFGFRKAEAYQANIDDYDEMAALNVISGTIDTETILNGGGTTTTDTTLDWADGETHTLEVRVDGEGAVTFYVDDAKCPAAGTFSFDAAEVVVPFFYFLHAAAPVAGAITLMEWEVGYQA